MGLEEDLSRQLQALNHCHYQIVKDLDVHDVLPDLLSSLVIDHRDTQLIDHEKSSEDKAAKLLQILDEKATTGQRNSTVIPVFINCLKKKYEWIYKRLTEDVPDTHSIPIPSFSTSFPDESRVFGKGLVINKFFDNVLLEEEAVFDPAFSSSRDQKFRIMLETGGVQCLPPFAIERKGLLRQIRLALENLKSNRYLVLTGMAGSGKSVLATQAVHDSDLVANYFPSGVFWLPIGKECSENKDALLAKMRILCDKLGESKTPNSFEHGADLLRTAFSRRTNTLLILDDVWRSEVIRAFDVGCRILITTRDLSVMDVVNSKFSHIEVGDGFSEKESLELFEHTLKINHNELPPQAKQIHCECKGSPMVMSLISSLMKEHQMHDIGRWQYYLDSLTKRKFSRMGKFKEYNHESIVDAISLSFESLSEENKQLYSDFALFQDDVGIPCPVLMTLWNMQKYEVEDKMKHFVKKSLVIEEYDSQKKHYIYSIHDLLLDYLKTKLWSEKDLEKDSHKKLIKRYLDICDGEFHKLPDDGYIHFYLGYHLYKAKMYQYFQKIYFDLQFVGEKIRISGLADLLVDIRKYFDFIVGDDEERLKQIEEIQTFAQLVGHRIYGQLDVDVIQIALQTPHLPWINKQAKIFAQIDGSRLYLEWMNAGQCKHAESTVLCSDNVYTVKFVGARGCNFIAGLSNGCIQLCDLDSSAVCHIFFGHNDSVQSLDLYPPPSNDDNKPRSTLTILSASADSTCKLWNLKTILDEVESKPYELKTGRMLGTSPSPKLRPDNWAFDHQRDDSYLTFELHTAPVSYAKFSQDGKLVVSTSTNEIMIWNSTNGQIFSKISPAFEAYPNLTFQRCIFPPDFNTSYLLCSAENQIVLMSTEKSSLYTSVEAHPMRIVDILFLSQDSFCSVSENEVGIWKVKKMNSKGKALRSRSLSPSRCIQFFSNGLTLKTEVVYSKVLRPCKTLDPKDIEVNWNESNNATGHVVKSSSATNGTMMTNGTSAIIDSGNLAIQIVKEDVLQNKASGILLCAAITKSQDGQGKLLACGTSDHKIVLWRIDQKMYLGSFTSHNGWVTCLDFSTVDLCTILSGSEDRSVMVWDIQEEEKATREPQKYVHFSSTFICVGFDEGYFLSVFFNENNVVQIYKDSKRIYETCPFSGSSITAVAISKCGRFVSIGTEIGNVYQILTEEIVSNGKGANNPAEPLRLGSLESKVVFLEYGFFGKNLVAGSSSGSFMIFEGIKILQKFIISTTSCLKAHFLLEKFVIVVAQDSSTMLVNLEKKQDIRTWKSSNQETHVTCSECSFDGSFLALGTIKDGVFFLNISEIETRIVETCLNAKESSPIRSIALNDSSTKLAVGYDNGFISIWIIGQDIPSKEMELILHKSWVRHLQFSPSTIGNAHWLISCGDNLAIWNLDKQETKPRRRSSFMAERRRRRSGESPARNSNRLSLEIPDGSKIGRQGKRELLQQFAFRGNYARYFVTNPSFGKILTVDDTGIFYILEALKSESLRVGPQ